MKNNELLKYCRYYRGEKDNPYSSKDNYSGYFWDYEKVWVEQTALCYKNDNTDFFDSMVEEYLHSGLAAFQQTDDTPVTLKALLYNRYSHWSGLPMLENAEPFKNWYLHEYSGVKL